MTGLPTQTEFTASNGLKVATDIRGAVGVQWGSPRTGGWTFHDPNETLALQEFFAQQTPIVASPEGWKVALVEDDEHVSLSYPGSFELEPFSGEFDTGDLDALIAQLIAVRTALGAT